MSQSNGRKKPEVAAASREEIAESQTPRSVQIASEGIVNSRQAKAFLSSLISDVMTESVSTKMAGAACNAMGKLIKLADLEKTHSNTGTPESFTLVESPNSPDPLAERESQLMDELNRLRLARGEVANKTPAPARV